MPWENIRFAIIAPLVLMLIIAVLVVGIGETLLATHHWANEQYHVGDLPSAELSKSQPNNPEYVDLNKQYKELAALYPVGVALGIATLALLGGIVASMMAPQRPSTSSHH